jgi:hypothetical protein
VLPASERPAPELQLRQARHLPRVPPLPGALHVRRDGEAARLRPPEDARSTPVTAFPAAGRYTRGIARREDAVRHATWVLRLLVLSATAAATDGPGVLLTCKSLGDQDHTIRVGVADRAGEKVFSVTVGRKDPKVPLELEQGYLLVYDDDRRIVGCWVQAHREKGTASYEFAVAETHLAKSQFSFSAATATPAERKKLPSGGGWTNYTVPLQEFARDEKGPAAPARLAPPEVRFAGAEVRYSHTHLLFDLVNPNADPVPYHGYTADSFEPKLPTGTIAPLFKIEYRRGGAWKDDSLVWCGFGIGPVSVPGKAKARFDAPLYLDDWDEVRVGVAWYAGGQGKDSKTAWSKPVTRKDVAKK